MADAKKNAKFMEKLLGGKGAVVGRKDPHAYVIRSPSPSFNFIFGNAHGLPSGLSVLLYGPPRGGKSIISNAMIGQLHRDDPEAWAVKYNTEFREGGQLTKAQADVWGIDMDRYVAYERNDPEIFDHIEQDLAALVQDGMKLKLVIIDSVTQIQGRRGMNSDTIMKQQIGDNAATIQEGLKRILPVQRKLEFGLILTSHIRSQIDARGTPGTVHTSQTTAIRPAVSYGTQHHCEYYVYVEPDMSKEGKEDLSGNKFEDSALTDFQDKAERTGHKIKARMVDSSLGPKGRNGEFTFDYNKGIINTHEEVFLLGVCRGIIERPNNRTYVFGDKQWTSKDAMLEVIKNDNQLREVILQELRRREFNNDIKEVASITSINQIAD